jgi:hypothetical protein
MAKINPQIQAVLRTAANANSYPKLEKAISFPRLRATCVELVEAYERAAKRAAERQEARRWSPREDEILRVGFRERGSVGELAEQLGRTPLVVEKRLVTLGLLKIAHIRRAPIEDSKTPASRETPLPPATKAINREPENGPEVNLSIQSCDSGEDELLDRHAEELAREQAEADRIREEEAQTELEELQAAAGARAAQEQAALDDLPDQEAA